jgi:WD40 repeat protein
MGVVYKARQIGLDRLVALKMILAGGYAGTDEVIRFRTEAEAVARLQHPHIVQIFEVGEHDGRPFFSLELCSGGSLSSKLAGNPMAPRQAAQLVEMLARGIHVAHLAGVIHRDLKPANILLQEEISRQGAKDAKDESDGQALVAKPQAALVPKITDFGLAKKLDIDEGQTRTGAILGTPSYMPPEQAGGASKTLGPAADIYALGAILYELLTGRPPFKAATPLDTVLQVISEEPVPPLRLQAGTPRDLNTICLKCLEKDPAKRYGSAHDLAEDLRRFLGGEPIAARPVGPVERLLKWTRRRPALAAMMGFTILVVLVSFGLVSWKWWEATVARGLSEKARLHAEEQEQLATRQLERAETNLYFNRIALAEREWLGHNVRRAREVLALCPPTLRDWEWGYLNHLCQGGLLTLQGVGGSTASIALSPDRKHLASGGFGGEIQLWELTRGTAIPRRHWAGHRSAVRGLAFSPDGRGLVSAGADGQVILWNVATGKSMLPLRGHSGSVHAVAFRADGKLLASGGEDGTVRLWDSTTGKCIGTLREHKGTVSGVAFHPTSGQLASCGHDNTIRIWDTPKQKERLKCESQKDTVTSVAFSPDGKWFCSSAGDGTIAIWNADTGRLVRTLRGHTESVTAAVFSPDGEHLASSSADETLRIWEVSTGQTLHTLCGHDQGVNAVAYSPDGGRIVSASRDRIKLWDALSAPTAWTFRDRAGAVKEIAFLPNGNLCATLGEDGGVRIRDTRSGEVHGTLLASEGPLTCLAVNPSGDRLACACADRTIRLWDIAGKRQVGKFAGHTGVITCLAFAPNGKQLASAGHDEVIKIWDISTGRVIQTLPGHKDTIRTLAFHPDGAMLVSGGEDRLIKLWTLASGDEITIPCREAGSITHVAFRPKKDQIAVASSEGLVLLLDVKDKMRSWKSHSGPVHRLTFSPAGGRLVTAGADKAVKIWDVESGQEILRLRGHTDEVLSAAFSPDGTLLATGSADHTLRFWLSTPQKGE